MNKSRPVGRLRSLRGRACGVALLALAACAGGPQQGPRGEPLSFEAFNAADTDGDGKLSLAEAQKALPPLGRQFTRVDSDRSGYLSWAEVKAARFGLAREAPPLPERY